MQREGLVISLKTLEVQEGPNLTFITTSWLWITLNHTK